MLVIPTPSLPSTGAITSPPPQKTKSSYGYKDIIMISGIAISIISALTCVLMGQFILAGNLIFLGCVCGFGEYFIRKYNNLIKLPTICDKLQTQVTKLGMLNNSLSMFANTACSGVENALNQFHAIHEKIKYQVEQLIRISQEMKANNATGNETLNKLRQYIEVLIVSSANK